MGAAGRTSGDLQLNHNNGYRSTSKESVKSRTAVATINEQSSKKKVLPVTVQDFEYLKYINRSTQQDDVFDRFLDTAHDMEKAGNATKQMMV